MAIRFIINYYDYGVMKVSLITQMKGSPNCRKYLKNI
jgi:hypothetical protein